ncbi:Na+/H+ antiporter [Georgenia faecalis]|uniref:Na+/H+ antiporter n=1 Tax=Georgenia faecalis TaxID=2483799 RepID=A0ABV9D9W1_9MICO|nr:Na+/H+ antiporter [Georgenia faecalis]
MEGLGTTVTLGLAVLAGAILAPRWRIAAPLVLLVLGLVLGSVPALPEIDLPPEAVLLLFLPVILFWEALTTSLRSIRRDFRGIVLLSTLLVVATAFAVAWVATLFGMPWDAALILGAAVAPPDATAVAALARSLPHRNVMLLKAESLTNDGTALVLYAIAVGIATGGAFTALTVTGMVLLSYLGGIATGVLVAGAAYLLMRRLDDPTTVNIALLLVPFVAFLLAELVHASGVLAVVVAGLVLAFASPRISTAASRQQTESAWPLGSYLLNGSLFVLVGMEVQAVAREITATHAGRLVAGIVAVWLTLLLVRFGFQMVTVAIIRFLDRRPSQLARRMSHRARVVSTVAGFRGAVSLAIALSVPTTLDDGRPFPGRDEIIVVAAGVIVLTLVIQGPLLPAVVRWARFPEDTTPAEELRLAERAVRVAGMAAVPDLAAQHGISDEVRNRIVDDIREHLLLLDAPGGTIADGDAPGYSALARQEEENRLRLALLDHKRDVLVRLRRDGTIDDAVARRVQARLDVEELRLTGSSPLD